MGKSNDSADTAALRRALVDKLVNDGLIHFPEVEAAFRAVPRHLFLPDLPPEQVYRDEAIVTRRIDGVPVSSSSQPAAMAIMVEQLGLEPGDRVLEIGAGTGYNAAIIAHLVGDTGHIITVDIDEEIVSEARARLAAAGVEGVQVVCADGGLGYPDAAPYDRIILSVGAWDIAPAWIEQLKPGGRLLLPLWIRTAQKTVAFERADDHLASVSVSDCAFMRLRGAFAGPEAFVSFGPEAGLTLALDDREMVDVEATYALLAGPSRDWPTGVTVTSAEIWRSLGLWLALHEPGFCSLIADAESASTVTIPYVYGRPDMGRGTVGALEEGAIALLTRASELPEGEFEPPPFELVVRSLGAGDALARRLVERVAVWDAAGRPTSEGLRVRAYPRDAGYIPAAGEVVVPKRWTQLVFNWV